jgi:ankyrin repeat protein
MVQVLLDNGATVDSEDDLGRTPLHLVTIKGRFIGMGYDGVSTAELLLEHGADIHAKDTQQSTPLHFASYRGVVEIVRLLLDHGANASVKNDLGLTPLHVVSQDGYSEDDGVSIARLLLEHGADINARCLNNNTPLDVALCNKHKIASFLLHYGAIEVTTPMRSTWGRSTPPLGLKDVFGGWVSKNRLRPMLLRLPLH